MNENKMIETIKKVPEKVPEFINDINNNNPKKHSDFINIEKDPNFSSINIQKHMHDLLNGITFMEPHLDDNIDKIDLDELIGTK